MREQPAHGNLVARLLSPGDRWEDVATDFAPPAWRSLVELDDDALVAEADAVTALGAAPPSDQFAAVSTSPSAIADVLDRHFDTMREAGTYVDAPEIEIDVAGVPADPFGGDADPIADLALAVHGPQDSPDDATAGLADPFFDDAPDDRRPAVDDPTPDDSTPDDAVRDDAVRDDLADDITGQADLDQPLRIEHHDPFDAVDEAVEPRDGFGTDGAVVRPGLVDEVPDVTVDAGIDPTVVDMTIDVTIDMDIDIDIDMDIDTDPFDASETDGPGDLDGLDDLDGDDG